MNQHDDGSMLDGWGNAAKYLFSDVNHVQVSFLLRSTFLPFFLSFFPPPHHLNHKKRHNTITIAFSYLRQCKSSRFCPSTLLALRLDISQECFVDTRRQYSLTSSEKMTLFNKRNIVLLLVQIAAVSSRSIGSSSSPLFVPKNIVETPTSINPTVALPGTLKEKRSLAFHGRAQTISVSRGGGAVSIDINEVKGVAIFTALDYIFRKAFKKYGINFPSQLGGCCILFVSMLLAEIVKPGFGDGIFALLSPGAGLLAKWLPVFFVPGLAMLPLAPSMGSPLEVSIFAHLFYLQLVF